MRMIPKWPCGTGSQAEKPMFESLAGEHPGHKAGANVRAALGG